MSEDKTKKDACYHKVKSRYDVWPSAYASGALVKCRKVGAKNWGNKTDEDIENSSDYLLEDGVDIELVEEEEHETQQENQTIEEKRKKRKKSRIRIKQRK